MSAMSKVDTLREIIQLVADERVGFFLRKGQGLGNLDTNEFMRHVRNKARAAFGADFSEKPVCGNSGLKVDYYFPDEQTIVEIALGLLNPNTEFEKDILKALLAQENAPIHRLVLIGKYGAHSKCSQPGRAEFIQWARRKHGLQVDVYDIANNQQSSHPQ